MIFSAESIEQPCSGIYTERIYDITNPWNSRDWTWIKFTDENGEWCGEFRGQYRGVAVSEKYGIIVVLTTDYLFILDIHTAELIKYDSQANYIDITTSPNGSVFLTDGYGVEIVVKNSNDKIETSVIESIPVNPDNLKFEEWHNHILKMSCCEFLNWENEVELYLDCDSLKWIGKRSKSMKKNEKQERYLNNLLLKGVVDYI